MAAPGTFAAVLSLACVLCGQMAAAWPQQNDRDSLSRPVILPSSQQAGPSSSSSLPSSGAGASNSSSSSSTSTTGWLFHSMTKMALETHKAIVTGTQIRSCPGVGPTQGGDKRNDNLIFSPLSMSAALSILFVGSWGDTLSQLRTGLGYPGDKSLSEADIHATYKASLEALLRPGRGVDVSYSNSLFGGAGLSVILYFYQDIQNYYKSAIRGVDFEKKPVQAMKEINRWVSEQTKGKITEILTAPPATDTKMAIANAVHFKGAWEYPFSEQLTKIEDFTVNEGDVVKIPMMKDVMEVPFVRDPDLGLSMVALPYKTTEFALYVVLPDQPGINGLVNVERALTEPDIDGLIRRMNVRAVQVALPRIKLSWRGDLRETLARLGVCDAFSSTKADFRRLAVQDDGLFISYLLHQAEMEVNEKGTEAAAVTLALGAKMTAVNFSANRPFLFFIRDNRTGLPLFWGRVVRPEAASGPSTKN